MPGCNCDYEADECGYRRTYTDPRCEALNEEPNAHVAEPFRGVLNRFAKQ